MEILNERGEGQERGWSKGLWAAAALLLLLPVLAMQVTDEVAWELPDFAVAAALLFGACLAYELVARAGRSALYRAALGLALVAAVTLVWLTLAVGLIGTEANPANLMYGAVLAVGIMGAVVARFRPRGMARALGAAALAQAGVAAVAILNGLGDPWSGPLELLLLNGFFVTLFLGSAWLFRRAATERREQGTA